MNPAPNLFFVGPMGAGKSTIGRRVAERLGLEFFDLDSEIEDRTGAAVTLIFELEGEAGFRRRERELLAELAAQNGIALATGGGAVLDAENRRILSQRGFVIWLDTPIEQQLARLARDRKRPLLAATDRRESLEALAAERGPLYSQLADLTVTSGGGSVAATAERIVDQIERRWQRGAAPGDAA